jgi:hypothetical protein
MMERIVAEYVAGTPTTALARTYGIGKGTVLRLIQERASPSVREVRALPSRWPKTSKFSDAKLAFSLGKASNSNTVQSVAPPGDPTVAKIGGSWYIYYGARDGIHYATLK